MRNWFKDDSQERERISPAILILLLLCILCCCCALLWGTLGFKENGSSEPLYSATEANYFTEYEYLIPNIDPKIIREVILDSDPAATADVDDRMATLESSLLTPVPSATLSPEDQLTATATVPTSTPPSPTVTPSLVPTSTPQPTQTVVSTTAVPPTSSPKPPSPSIRIIKQLSSYDDNDSSNSITLGDDLWYQFTVQNTGTTKFSFIVVKDLSFSIPVSCPSTILSRGTSMTCKADNSYQVSIADANAGQVKNLGYASGDFGGVRYTDTDKIATSVQQNPAVTIIKEVDTFDDNDLSGTATVNDGIWYRFVITNTGNVPLSNISVSDDTFGIPVSCSTSSLIPGSSTTCTTTTAHIITSAEISSGEIINKATVSARFNGLTYTDSDTLTIPLSVQLDKRLASYDDNDLSGSITLGDDLWYEFEVNNIGTTTLNSYSVTDDTFGISVTCPVTPLTPGSSATCTAATAHTVTLAEANAALVQNAASVTASASVGPDVSDTDTLDTTVTQDASLSLAKSASTGTYDTVGQVIDYSFDVENAGNVTITGPITIDDDLTNNESCPAGDLAPGTSMTCTASYTITQGDLDSGSVANTASATGASPSGVSVTSASDTVTISAVQNPQIEIVKSVASYTDNDSSSSITLGDDLWYQFVLTNSGNVTLTGIGVTDNTFGLTVSCPVSTLAPGASTTCTAGAHTISLGEANAGQVTNTATATASLGSTVVSSSDTITTPITQNPSYTVTKAADKVSISAPGTVNYAITIQNTGNISLTGISISDPLLVSLTGPSGDTNANTMLDVSETWTYSGSYSATQAVIDGNGVDTNGTIDGDGDIDNLVSVDFNETAPAQTANASVSITQSPAIQVVKEVSINNGATWSDANTATGLSLVSGTNPRFRFTVTNTGNVTLSNLTLADSDFNTTGCMIPGTLAPSANYSCILTGAWAAGQHANTATAEGDFGATTYSDTDDAHYFGASPAIQVTKNGTFNDESGDGFAQVGETISYTFTVTNTGNITLSNITLNDPDITLSGAPITSLTPGAADSATFTGSYTITQPDIDAGIKTNIATVSGSFTDDNATTRTATNTGSSNVTLPQLLSIDLVKTGTFNDESGDGFAQAGETISYAFTVSNTSNVTLTNITVSDPGITLSGGPIATLAVGASDSTTFTGSHTLLQADVDAGVKNNTATVTGKDPGNNNVTNIGSDSVTLTQNPIIQIVKTSTTTNVTSIGQVIPYAFAVSNIGNTTLTGITVTDPACDAAPAYQSGDTNTDNQLDLSETWNYTCSRTVTQAEMDAGGNLTNTVTADSTESAADTDTLDIPITQNPAISVTKTGTWNDDGDGIAEVGETISYAFTVTNDGNVTLTNITLSDPGITLSGGPIATLAVGAFDNTTFTGSYVLTQSDIDAGSKDNTATVTGTPPIGADVTNTGSDSVALPQSPAIQIVKSLASYDDNDVTWNITRSDSLWYQFEVTNTGNVTLMNVNVTDDTFTITVTCPSTTLAPNESVICTADASHTVTFDEANAGQVSNSSTANGEFDSTPYTDSNTLVTTVNPYVSSIVSGQVRDDSDRDGDLGDNDAGLANVKIELDDGECSLGVDCRFANTDAIGIFTFNSVADGSYVLVENDLTDYDSTADSDPPNDNQINVIILSGASSTNNIFLNTAKVALCTAPDPVNGFVVSTTPNNGATNIPLSTASITVTLNQPMITTGGGSVLDIGNYELKNQTNGNKITITSVAYDPVTYTVTLNIDILDPDWQAGTLHDLTIKGLKNSCGDGQNDVVRSFTTELEISGQVTNDLDGKGIYGVTITLSGTNCGGVCGTTTTDLNGNFRFLGYDPGNYTLDQTDLPGYSSVSDSDGGDANQISLTLVAGSNSTGHLFVDTPVTCTVPGVSASDPANGQTGVLLSDDTLTVTFDQPMSTEGGGSVLDKGNFDNNIDNLTLGGDVPILNVEYDPNTYTATLTLDTSDPQWQAGSQFRLRVKSGLETPCGAKIGADVEILFTTEAYISGQVLNSLDSNGIYGTTITLSSAVNCGGLCDTTTTDLNGDFRFSGYIPGDYTLLQTNLPGYSTISDSDPPIDDELIGLTLLAGSNSTGHQFIDTPTCTGGANFVTSTSPANGATGVSLSTDTITVVFNQPMSTNGGGSVFDIGNFDNNIDNQTLGGDVSILAVSYDPNTYTATLTIDASDPQWKPGSQFRLRIKDSIKNACDGRPAANVDVFFTTDLVISGQVRNDQDKDGDLVDPDQGIAGVAVELKDDICSIGSTIQTTTTNAGGFFTFSSLSPGNYMICETDPGSYGSTADSDGSNDNQIGVTLVAGTNSIGHKFLDALLPIP